MDKKQPEALRRSTAADGKTELFNLPGYPLMVRAVDFNRIHTESEMRRTALLDEMQKATPTAEQQAAPKAAPGDVLDEALRERDDAEDFIDALLDEVLGHERPEWSSSYGRADALNDVQERMTSLHKPAVDKAWGQFQSAMAAPQPSPAPLSESIDQLERELAIIGVVGVIDGHDVVRRESVLEIARRAAIAAQGCKV